MYIIVKAGDMPYYAGTHNGVISWSSEKTYAKLYDWWVAAQIQAKLLRDVTGNRSIRTLQKGQ